jgi:quercetin dioxygenase-like cupin family protein
MKVIKEKFVGGWFIGNFEPSAFYTKDVEVCYKVHEKDEKWPAHYHRIATEINYLIRGKMVIQGQELVAGDVFVINPHEVADPTFMERCELIVVKVPSIKGDKYEV